ncbi:MAG: rane protein involved in the export of O-antigen and teichoic acid [Rhodospirillales bacterium]|jgi:O-antigen/teichoic acid export membrane protein|nr:rane protein involved in the export of O-antigen and teichoic acid [Rhodospirillales bacterium]
MAGLAAARDLLRRGLGGASRLPKAVAQALRGRFLRDVAIVGLGTAAAQAISLLAAPLLTRHYAPEQFGLFATITTVSATIGMVVCLKYETGILLAPDDDRATAAALASIAVALTVTALLTLAAVPLLLAFGGDGRHVTVLAWSLPLALVGGLSYVGNAWATRRRRFTSLAAYQLARGFGGVALQLMFALLALGAVGLIAGQALGQLAGLLVLLVPMARDLAKHSPVGRSAMAMQRALQEHRALAAYSAPQTLIHALADSLPILTLGAAFTVAEAGWFWLAQRILMLPSLLVAESLRSVFFQRLSELRRAGSDVFGLFGRTTAGLAALGAPVVLVLFLVGPDIFALAFGEAWRAAGHYARILAPAWWMQFAAVPSSVMFQVLGRQRAFLFFDTIMFIGAAVALGTGVLVGDAWTAVALYVGAIVLGHFAQIAYIMRAMLQERRGATPLPQPK